MSTDEARRIALSLPEAVEHDHHGRPSFRVAGRIFATLWDPEHMNVMLDEPGILTAVEAHPDVCAEVMWGKRLAAVRVTLPAVEPALLGDLLADAWERKAPAGLASRRAAPTSAEAPARLASRRAAPTSAEAPSRPASRRATRTSADTRRPDPDA